jgi:hypothetical protein
LRAIGSKTHRQAASSSVKQEYRQPPACLHKSPLANTHESEESMKVSITMLTSVEYIHCIHIHQSDLYDRYPSVHLPFTSLIIPSLLKLMSVKSSITAETQFAIYRHPLGISVNPAIRNVEQNHHLISCPSSSCSSWTPWSVCWGCQG